MLMPNGGGVYVNSGTLHFDGYESIIGGWTTAGKNTATNNGGGVYVNGGTLKFSDNTPITYNGASSYGGGAYLAGGTMYVDRTSEMPIAYNTASSGAGIALIGGTLTANGGDTVLSIFQNTASSYGGGLYFNGGTVNNTITNNKLNVTIYENTAGTRGNGVYTITGTNTMTNLGMVRNHTAANGAGIYVRSGNTTINGATVVKDNTATSTGGGVYVYSGTLTLNGTTITSNTATTTGGGIYLRNASGVALTSNGATIVDNTATNNGGGIYVAGANVTITFASNTTNIGASSKANKAQLGGGIYVANGTLNFNSTTNIAYNEVSSTGGGGIYMANGTLNVTAATHINNNKVATTSTGGGGIYMANGTITTTGTDSVLWINDNIATGCSGGGLYYIDGTITNNGNANIVIAGNMANNGGGVYCAIGSTGAKTIGNIGMIRHNTASENGGGIYYKGYNATAANATNFASAMTLKGNKADSLGGGIFVDAYPVNFTNAITISNNTVTKTNTSVIPLVYGGAGLYNNGGTVNFSGSSVLIDANVSNGHGGGIFNKGGTITCTGGDITLANNKAYLYANMNYGGRGGGIYDTAGTITIGASGNARNLVLSQDTAALGGGIFIGGGTLTCWGDITANQDTSRYQGGGIRLWQGATIDCKGNVVAANNRTASSGAGIYCRNATMTYAGTATVSNNKAGGHGGGICASQAGVITFKGLATISNNQTTAASSSSGAGLYITTSGTTINLEGGALVKDNNSGVAGGGMYVNTGCIINVGTALSPQNLVLASNTAANNGGGMSNRGTITCYGNLIDTNNSSANYGGGIYIHEAGVLTCKGTANISKNYCSRYGGGIYINNNSTGARAEINLEKGATVNYNSADIAGGGIYCTENGNRNYVINVGTDAAHPADIVVNYDTAKTGAGGGINNRAGIINCYGNLTANGNVSATNGGGIYNQSTLWVNGTSSICNNTATTNGGGIYTDTMMDLRKSYIVNNTAGGNGGGVYVNDNQNAGDYAATKIVKVGGGMKIIGNTVSGNENNLYVMSRNNIHFVETFADTSSVGVYCVRSATAYPAYGANNITVYGMREDDLFAKVDFSENDPINNAGRFFNDLTAVTGEFTSTGHTEAGGLVASPAPSPVASMVSNNRKSGSGDDLGAVKWQDYNLPIELLSFVGVCQNGITTFNWETMTETNNDYFTIEASSDAINYEAIATISGAGTTSQRQQYSYHINTKEGMMYYRLRQTDIDGQTEVFAPIAVQCSDNKSEEPTITIYPQPARDMFEINVQGEGVEIEQMSLYNMLGSCIKRQVVNNRTAAMSLETLSSGVYNVLIQLSNGTLYNKKVVVTK